MTCVPILIAIKFQLHKSFRKLSVRAIHFSECLRVRRTFSYCFNWITPKGKIFHKLSQESISQRSLTSRNTLFSIGSWKSQFSNPFPSIKICFIILTCFTIFFYKYFSFIFLQKKIIPLNKYNTYNSKKPFYKYIRIFCMYICYK